MKKLVFLLAILFFVGDYAVAQELVPATSDDVSEFDHQVSQGAQASQAKEDNESARAESVDRDSDNRNSENAKSNFGKLVSEEAHKLKAEGQEGQTKMGEWVSDQRRKNDQNEAGESDADHGRSASGSSDDARTSAPGSHGDSSDAGDSGSHHH